MNSKSNPTANTLLQNRWAHLALPVAMILLTITSGIAQGATSFTGKLQEVTITDAATANKPPTPVLKYTLNGNVVSVDASSSSVTGGNITQYNWDFGDGTKASGVKANHQYASGGSYPLTLTVVDSAGGVSITQQQLNLGTLFYWSADSLPQATPILSDIGNVTISRQMNDATPAPGFKGKCMQQTGNNQYYKIPMATIPGAKGTIRMYVRHSMAPDSADTTNRYFFRSTNDGSSNSLSAYTYRGSIFFYLYDSTGVLHRTYGEGKWVTDVWCLYEFSWDATTGSLEVKRDGSMLLQSTTTNWSTAIPAWGGQDFYFGHIFPIGSTDEIYITN